MAAVDDEGDGSVVAEGFRRVGRTGRARGRGHAEDGVRVDVLDELVHGGLDDGEVGGGGSLATEALDEFSVVEAATLLNAPILADAAVAPGHLDRLRRVLNLDLLSTPEDLVPFGRDRSDSLEARIHPELLKRETAAGLEKLSDDPIRLREVAARGVVSSPGAPREADEKRRTCRSTRPCGLIERECRRAPLRARRIR